MTIAASLESPEGQRLIDNVARTFNVDDDKAGRAVHALTDELQARIQRSMLSRGGVADVAALVTNPAAGTPLSNPQVLASPDAVDSGNRILDVLIGQGGHHALHDRVVALTVLVLVQHVLQVQVVLAGEARILRVDRIAVDTMAGKTGCRFLLAVLKIAVGQQ